ncbi:hypothetical protein [Tsukamurella pseudospumae]|uniref:YcxB-like protein domain-containing protein n=1 Tax=Tsukamurella pseudospumae TaxID=239498 RepID=A0A137ZZ74_9ACTN|nr:hypothetical protein [Tsukamurella pseudospumae]KXO97989.1 hypothetical protein AXK61_20715 [Tsukamurella pseudospumae]KXP03462.1 hypothetical protein AXK60_16705 [Tsukamurella pseudospumae]
MQVDGAPHHVWEPGVHDAERIARASALLVVRRATWIVTTVLCLALGAALIALGDGATPYIVILVLPLLLPALTYVVTRRSLRRSFASGAPWTSTFGPATMTIVSPAGISTLNYSDMTDVRARGPFVTITMRTAGRVSTFSELVPPGAVEFLRGRIGGRA